MIYKILVAVLRLILNIFFKLRIRGVHNIPKQNVIFVCAPHANQFVDPCILLTTCGRQVGFLTAAKSLRKFYIRIFANALGAIPVERPQDLSQTGIGSVYIHDNHIVGVSTDFLSQVHVGDSMVLSTNDALTITNVISATSLDFKSTQKSHSLPNSISNSVSFKILPKVDQSAMFNKVTNRLLKGKSIGIFPEGGSHDRSEFLPLKAGAVIMALGAMVEHPGLDVVIIPVGLNYFNAEKFRSTAVIEYGAPIKFDKESIDAYSTGGQVKKQVIEKYLNTIYERLKELTLTAPDYDQLTLIQMTRRLYAPVNLQLSPEDSLQIARKIALGYEKMKDDPRIIDISIRIKNYNQLLDSFGLSDHQAKTLSFNPYRAFVRLIGQLLILTICFIISLPGMIVFSPVFLSTHWVSKIKAKEALAGSAVKIKGTDVIATWKLLTAAVIIPVFLILYTIVAYLMTKDYRIAIGVFFGFPACSFGTLALSDQVFKSSISVYPLLLSVMQKTEICIVRNALANDVQILINDLGHKIIKNFEETRTLKKEIFNTL